MEELEHRLREEASNKQGISKNEFSMIRETTQLSLNEFCDYVDISPRTVQRKKPTDRLSLNASEKALLIARLYKRGYEVFGEKEKFIRWMEQENAALGAIQPKEYLYTFTGIELLLEKLGAIEHGFVA